MIYDLWIYKSINEAKFLSLTLAQHVHTPVQRMLECFFQIVSQSINKQNEEQGRRFERTSTADL